LLEILGNPNPDGNGVIFVMLHSNSLRRVDVQKLACRPLFMLDLGMDLNLVGLQTGNREEG
jgi:hypothetical protein